VITVGSTHRDKANTYGISFFSRRGPTGDGRAKPDLVAPGEKIVSLIPGKLKDTMDGTSMAAPHVSGAAALLLARYPELIGRPARVKEILCGHRDRPRPRAVFSRARQGRHSACNAVWHFSLFGDEQSVTTDLWNSVTEGVTLNTNVPLHEVIANDAKYFLAADDIRRSVLESVIACELAKNITFERLWHVHKKTKFRTGHVFKGSVNLPDHLDAALQSQIGHSYKQSHPKNFDEIEQLWLARGNIAHGGKEEYWWHGIKVTVRSTKSQGIRSGSTALC